MMSEQWNIIAKYLACEELSEEEKVILEKIKSDDEQRKYLQQSAEVFEKTTQILCRHWFAEPADCRPAR